MDLSKRCANMNHSRPKPPIKFCPICGEEVNRVLMARCDSEKHAIRRKDRDQFCIDCGKKLG
jgi:rRNA maturation endonuclease Nob1